EDDRRDQHPDRLDEGIAQRLHFRTKLGIDDAEHDAGRHGEEYLDPELPPPGAAARLVDRERGHSPNSNRRARLLTTIFCWNSASGANCGIKSTRSPSFGITLTLGCGQSVPQMTRSTAVSTILRANGTVSVKGGPEDDTRSEPQILTQHFSSRCISSIR